MMGFQLPELEFQRKRLATIPFHATVAATAWGGQSSGSINEGYEILKVTNIFLDDHVFNVRYYWLVGGTSQISTTGISSGTNIFAPWTPNGYFVGHDMIIPAFVNYLTTGNRNYLKLSVYNGNAYAVDVEGLALIVEV